MCCRKISGRGILDVGREENAESVDRMEFRAQNTLCAVAPSSLSC